MIDLGISRTRWTLPLLIAVAVVALTGLPSVAGVSLLPPAASLLLLAGAAGWYWSLTARVEPEALPKLRVAGLAVLVLLLVLLYGLLVAALRLPDGLSQLLFTLLLGAAATAVTVILTAAVDLALLTRLRWARWLGGLLAAGLPLYLVLAEGRALDLVPATLQLDAAPYMVGVAAALLAFVAPLEWVVELDARQRVIVLMGWIAALVPLGVAVGIGRLVEAPSHQLLAAAVSAESIGSIAFIVVGLARSTLALPGTRAYERKVRELDAIYDFGLTAGAAFNPEELQAAVLDSMRRVVEPDVAVFVEADAEGTGCSCVLLRAEAGGEHVYRFRSRSPWRGLAERFADRRPVIVVDHRKAPPGVLRRIWEPESGSSVIVPVIGQQGVPGAVLIAGRFETHGFNAGEVRSIAGFANQVGLALDHARLLRDTVESERRKKELEIARELQLNLLPKSAPELAGLDIAARAEPASEVGGDYFDYLPLRNGSLGIVVGDVSGHGMPAGLLMAIAKAAIHTQVHSGDPTANLMARLSDTLLRMSADNQFMTLVFAEVDLENMTLKYSNAGHHYPLHFSARTGALDQLVSNGLPLGLLPRAPGPFVSRPLAPGDLLVFYSDGVVEANRNNDDDMFGMARLEQVVLANRNRSAKTMVEAIFQAVRRFCGDVPLHDDATVVVARVLDRDALAGE